MKIRVLGAAAGGGVPQWNCNYSYSRRARDGDPDIPVRTQSSIAASANGLDWVLLNASPDIGRHFLATPDLHPRADQGLRSTPLKAVVVTNADVDHIAGLLTLRERQAFNLYASSQVLAVLDANPIFRVLDPALVRRIELPPAGHVDIEGPDGPTGISIESYSVPGKVALFMEDGGDPARFLSRDGDTIGIALRESGRSPVAHYIPGCAAVDEDLMRRIAGAELLLFDGTVFRDTEMEDAGVGSKTGRRMGHVPITGEDGSMAMLSGVDVARRVYIHINNTNPILDAGSAERRIVEAAGWGVAVDGQEFVL